MYTIIERLVIIMKNDITSFITSGLTTFLSSIVTDEIQQIILFALGCASFIFSIITSVLKWYVISKKKDGKIDVEDVLDLVETLDKEIKKVE